VAARSLENGGFEFKRRDRNDRWIVPVESAVEVIKAELDQCHQEMLQRFNL